MPLLNTDLGETDDSSSADTTTLVPGTGKQLRQGIRGLQQKKFKVGVKRGGGAFKMPKATAIKTVNSKQQGK